MATLKDMTGQVFGRLTIVGRAANSNRGCARWLCQCTCGNQKTILGDSLRLGTTVSCGCYRLERAIASILKHGMKGTPEYRCWVAMVSRCENKNVERYPSYGGRGITVCERWRASFENFYSDMGPRPSTEHSIDRVDVDGNYEPSNCRWATKKEQANNARQNIKVVIGGRTLSLQDAIVAAGSVVTYGTVRNRITRGWEPVRAVTTPTRPRWSEALAE